MTAAENIVVNPIIEYQAATPAIAIDVTKVNIDNLDAVNDVEIISGGKNYASAPNLLLFNPVSNTLVDDSSLQAFAPNQTVSNVNVIAPINLSLIHI